MSAEEVGTHLSLGIGSGGGGGEARSLRLAPPPPTRTVQLFGEVLSVQDDDRDADGDEAQALHHHQRGRPTAASRKKKRDAAAAGGGTAAAADSHQSKKAKSTCGDDGGGGRKKLRLTAAQATMLEDSFRAHNILSHVCTSSSSLFPCLNLIMSRFSSSTNI